MLFCCGDWLTFIFRHGSQIGSLSSHKDELEHLNLDLVSLGINLLTSLVCRYLQKMYLQNLYGTLLSPHPVMLFQKCISCLKTVSTELSGSLLTWESKGINLYGYHRTHRLFPHSLLSIACVSETTHWKRPVKFGNCVCVCVPHRISWGMVSFMPDKIIPHRPFPNKRTPDKFRYMWFEAGFHILLQFVGSECIGEKGFISEMKREA